MTSIRQNTPTEQNKEDNSLVLYRLKKVEGKVDAIDIKLDSQRTLTIFDLDKLQETIVTRFLDISNNLQKQIDTKASQSELQDLKRLFYSAIGFISTIITALVIAYLTTRS